MDNRMFGIVLALVAAFTVFGLMIKLSGPPNRYPPGVVTGLKSTGDWIRPEANAEQLADELTVDQLIDRWNRWPQKKGKEGVHLVYAEALALYGEEALPALPHLARAVKHFEPNLRGSVMGALVAIGDEGILPLVEALVFWPRKDSKDIALHIRWDAAKYLAQAGANDADLSYALPALRKCLLNPKNYVFTRQFAAQALASMGTDEAFEALEDGREWFYARESLSVEENRVLKIINIGLQ